MRFTHELGVGTQVRLDDGRIVVLSDNRKGLARYVNDTESIRSYQITAFFADGQWYQVIHTKAEQTLKSRFQQIGL